MTDPTLIHQTDQRTDGKTSELPSATVTIPAGEYAELLACRERLQALMEPRDRLAALSHSLIERDQEVAAFLFSRFGRLGIDAILEECRVQLGSKRTPSRSAAYRYRDRLRAAAKASETALRGV